MRTLQLARTHPRRAVQFLMMALVYMPFMFLILFLMVDMSMIYYASKHASDAAEASAMAGAYALYPDSRQIDPNKADLYARTMYSSGFYQKYPGFMKPSDPGLSSVEVSTVPYPGFEEYSTQRVRAVVRWQVRPMFGPLVGITHVDGTSVGVAYVCNPDLGSPAGSDSCVRPEDTF